MIKILIILIKMNVKSLIKKYIEYINTKSLIEIANNVDSHKNS